MKNSNDDGVWFTVGKEDETFGKNQFKEFLNSDWVEENERHVLDKFEQYLELKKQNPNLTINELFSVTKKLMNSQIFSSEEQQIASEYDCKVEDLVKTKTGGYVTKSDIAYANQMAIWEEEEEYE